MTKSYNGPTFKPLSVPKRGYPPAHVNNISRLDALLVAETVKLIEAEAPLDDAEANRQAARASGDREQRLLARAALLGQRLGLQQTLQAWRARAVIAWAALALLVFIAGSGLVQGLLGSGRTINVMLAFVAALGVHFLTLAVWLLSLVLGAAGSSALALSSLGSLSLRLAAWRAGSGGQRPQLLPAAISMLERGKMLPWLFGLASHIIWSAVFVLALAGLWFMFSFREYQLTWETTIQSRQFFIGFIEASGVLPRMLGFPVPDATALATGGPDAQRALAWWLMGCTFAYGLLPRFLLAVLSAAVVARRRRRLRLDTSDPYYRKLLARMEDLGRSSVVDPERPVAEEAATAAAAFRTHTRGHALVGFELPPEYDWPPPGVEDAGNLSINVSGAGDQLRNTLQRLGALRPARILFVCDQAASPDRGTARFLREAAACGRHAGLLLLPVRGAGDAYLQRWHAWLADSGLQALKTFDDGSAASAWLEARDE